MEKLYRDLFPPENWIEWRIADPLIGVRMSSLSFERKATVPKETVYTYCCVKTQD